MIDVPSSPSPSRFTEADAPMSIVVGVVADDEAIEARLADQLVDGADFVVVPATAVPSKHARGPLIADLADGSAIEHLPAAGAVAGRVDRWPATVVEAVAAAGAIVLVGSSASGADQDPALAGLRTDLARSLGRLAAAGASTDRLAVDATPAVGTTAAGHAALLRGHRRLLDLGRPVVGAVPDPPALAGLADLVGASPDDPRHTATAVASVLASAGCRAIRTEWPSIVRRVVAVDAAIEQARR